MLAEPVYRGPWHQLVAVRHCLCPDGRRRYVTITSEPDTYSTVPGRVQYRGRTVSGYVTSHETEGFQPDMKFEPIEGRVNSHLFEEAE